MAKTEKEYKTEAHNEKKLLKINFNNDYNRISSNIELLDQLNNYLKIKTNNFYIKYFLEGSDSINQSEEQLITRNFTNQITLNSRKSYYELEGYINLQQYYYYYYVFYYIFFIILCILFIKKNNISYSIKIVILLILGFYPYFISYVINHITNYLQKIYNKLPIHIYSEL